jgi:hypothetical protein
MKVICDGFRVATVMCLLSLFGSTSSTSASPQQTGQDTSSAPTKKTTVTTTNPVNDSIPNSFKSSVIFLSEIGDPKTKDVNDALLRIQAEKSLPWRGTGTGIAKVVQTQMPPESLCSTVNKSQVYIFHITHWTQLERNKFQLESSSWYAYTLARNGSLIFAGLSGTGAQSVYGKRKALIIGIAGFDKVSQSIDGFEETYNVSVLQGTPENVTDLGILISSLGGFSGAKALGISGAGVITPFVVTVGCQLGTAKLPFTLTVSDGTISKAGDKPPQSPSAGTITCTGTGNVTPCSSTHSFESKDKEYWDVSIGVTTPGSRETKYTFSSGAVQRSITRHTDLYGMADFYPAGYWWPKDGPIPHLNVGLPLTSQSFYRPYIGLSESLTGWTTLQRKLSLPIGINFFAGTVYMKTQHLAGNPTSQAEFNADLKHTRVWKGLFGIEVPISSMASKIGKKTTSSAKGGSNPSGASASQ